MSDENRYDEPWQVPLKLELPSAGPVQVWTTRAAADVMMDDWAPDHSDEYSEALRICLEVFENNCGPEDARSAFTTAAQRAGVLKD